MSDNKKAHLNYRGTLEFNICTVYDSEVVKQDLAGLINKLNEDKNYDGDIDNIKINKVSLCEMDCLSVKEDEYESEE